MSIVEIAPLTTMCGTNREQILDEKGLRLSSSELSETLLLANISF